MCRNMTANFNKVIYFSTDILLVSRGKQFVKAIAVTNELLFQLSLSKRKKGRKKDVLKKQYLKLLSTTALCLSVSLFFVFQRFDLRL